jgi:hypothetical protein
MKPLEALEAGQSDMFRSRLDQIIDMGHDVGEHLAVRIRSRGAEKGS